MLKMFNYTRSNNENQNAIVDSALELARAYYDGKKPAAYDEKNKLVLESMAKFAVEGTKFEAMYENEGLKIFNHSQVKNSTNVRENFDVVLAQIVSAIVPEVVNDTFARFIGDIPSRSFLGSILSSMLLSSSCFGRGRRSSIPSISSSLLILSNSAWNVSLSISPGNANVEHLNPTFSIFFTAPLS